jgi:hypothetical protein
MNQRFLGANGACPSPGFTPKQCVRALKESLFRVGKTAVNN